MERFKIFLAHSSQDNVLTDKIYQWFLNQSYIDYTWIDKIELKPGDYLKEKIDTGVGSSDFILPILTPNSIKSKWVRYEIKKTFEKEKDLKVKAIIPILKDCKIPRYLKDRIYITIDDVLHGIDKVVPGILDYYILEIYLDPKSFEIEEEKIITELNKFLLGNKKQWYVIINTNLFEILPRFIKNRLLSYRKQFKESYTNQFRKLYLFKQQLQKLSHNLSYVISDLIYHIIKKNGNGSFVVQIISEAIKNIIMNVHVLVKAILIFVLSLHPFSSLTYFLETTYKVFINEVFIIQCYYVTGYW